MRSSLLGHRDASLQFCGAFVPATDLRVQRTRNHGAKGAKRHKIFSEGRIRDRNTTTSTSAAPAGRPGHNAGLTYPAEILSPDEVDRLVAAASARSSSGLRTRALILVMQRAGLRVAEALALRPTDVDLDRATLRVLHGKGDKARTVPLEPGACAAVQMWLARRAELRRVIVKSCG